MQVLFCHDGPIRKSPKGRYFGIAHNDDLFSRYKIIGENIATAIRVEGLKENFESFSEITLGNFKVYEIMNPNNIKGILKRKKIKQQIYMAVKESDYIIARLPSFIGNIAIDYAIKMKKPYLTELVACPWDALWNHSFKGKIVAPWMFWETKSKVKNSKYVIYVTNEFLQRRYPTKGENISCSNVVIKEIEKIVLSNRLKKIKNKDSKEKIIIGTTAAINVRYKGQQYIIKALGELKKKGIVNYEYQLVGAGDNSYLKKIAEKHNVSNQVKFMGPKKHDDVFEWLDQIDIYAQPSKQEGLPRALIEAMSRGVPSIGADTAGIPELLNPDYIFSNNRNNHQEISKILLSFSKKNMDTQSKLNFSNAMNYKSELIEIRRNSFYKNFKECKNVRKI